MTLVDDELLIMECEQNPLTMYLRWCLKYYLTANKSR